MNKYEQLIEYIINEQDAKARELFHRIVVEKSRNIYESLIDEEDFNETMGGNEVDDLVDEISIDENGMNEEEDMEDADMGDDMEDGMDVDTEHDIDSDVDMEDYMDQETEDDMGDSSTEERISDLETALDELKAEFDALMADEENEPEHNDGIDDPEFDHDSEEDEEEGDDDTMVREYVETVGEVYKGKLDPTSDGETVGAGGDRPTVNKSSVVARKNDMGGTSSNIARGGSEQSPDGKPVPKANNRYTSGQGDLPGAGKFQNVPGAHTKGYTNKATSYEKQHGKEGQTTDGKVPVSSKSIVGGRVR